MSIRSKLFLAFSVVLTLAIGVASYGVHAISQAESLVVRLYDEPFMAMSYARAAQTTFTEARMVLQRGFLLQDMAHEANEPSDAKFIATMNDAIQDLAVVRKRMAQAGHAERVANAQQLTQDWYRVALQMIKSPADSPTERSQSTDLMHQADIIAAEVDQIVEDASEYGFRFRVQSKASVAASQSNLITLATLTVIAGILFSLGITSSFGRAIRNAMSISERIAAGDLSKKISTTRRDELGRLLVSLEQMQESLQKQAEDQRLVAETKDRDHASQIACRQRMEQQISDFRCSVGKMLLQSNEMAGRMNLTARTLSMISADADQQAKEAADAAEETSNKVATVAVSTEQLDASIREITGRLASATNVVSGATELTDATEKMVLKLAESTNRIDNVVGLIRSIAERTNLLALNATIEAARAGEAGRGFSVVASEVKALATQTAKATEEISGQISDVQFSTGFAVEKIKSIFSVMTEINNVTTEISAGVHQQGTATEEIARNIQDVANAARDVAKSVSATTNSISDTSRAASEVLETAAFITSHTSDLRETVDHFLRLVAAS